MRQIVMLGLAAALPLSACATDAPRPAPSRSQVRPPAVAPAVRDAASPAAYVTQAASIDLFVVRSSELALMRTQHRAIREIAQRMISGHQGTAAQLSMAGRRLNLLPRANMLPHHEAMYSELAAGGNFNAAYVRHQRAVHQAALRLHSDYARRGTSPTLKPLAANAAAIERGHLELLGRL